MMVFLKLVCDTGWFVLVPTGALVSLLFQRQLVFHLIFPCVLYYIKLHYITLSYYLVYASLLSLLQLFFCLHVRLLYSIKYYFTYLLAFLHSSGRQRQKQLRGCYTEVVLPACAYCV